MDLFDTLRCRRSVRQYRPDRIPPEHIRTILGAANIAPSALNHKPWEFFVVTGAKISDMGKSFGAVIERIRETRGENLPEDLVTFARTYGNAPVAIVVLCRKSELPNYQRAYLESASAAMENLLLAATALGLGSCWMTGPLEDEPGLRQILDIPENLTLVAVTPLGYPAEIPSPHDEQDPGLDQKIRWIC